jgi:hypothetical protein
MGDRMISPVCPKCQSRDYKKVRPQSWVAFGKDRLCTTCFCRYTPPTPLWAGPVFLVVGLLLAVVCGLIAVASLLQGRVTDPIGTVVFGALAILGMAAIAHGVRVLVYPARV